MYDRARERVREILDGPRVDPLPNATSDGLDRILAAADREVGRGLWPNADSPTIGKAPPQTAA